jgi:precorrin-6A synthase
MELDFEMIPGISSIQALAASHRIPLNRIGEAVTITPARRLKEGLPADPDSVVVVLDGEQTFNSVDADAYDIYWGANLGTDREILVSGKLSEVKADIESKRAQARREDGWIMDTYLLRKRKESLN